MIAYFDASALVKLVKDEEGSDVALGLWASADAVVTSQLTYAETRSALRSGVKSGTLTRANHPVAVRELAEIWSSVLPSNVDAEIGARAADLVDRHGLHGADAVHLSTALAAHGDDFVFVTWDRRLAEGALAEGLPVAPSGNRRGRPEGPAS